MVNRFTVSWIGLHILSGIYGIIIDHIPLEHFLEKLSCEGTFTHSIHADKYTPYIVQCLNWKQNMCTLKRK